VRFLYAVCGVCETTVAGPTPDESRLDGQALVHCRVTGHPVDVLDDSDPDEIVYRIPGEPGLFVDPGPR
jgi:hypothetical protein